MELNGIKIFNFRSCANISLEVQRYNPIVGYNNAGKSTCLKAISWLLKRFALNESFFGNPVHPVIVEGVINGVTASLGLLPVNQQNQIIPFIVDDSINFRRRQDQPGTSISLVKLEVQDSNGNWAPNPTGLDNALGVLFPEPVYIRAMDDAGDDVGKFGAKNTIGLLLKYAIEAAKLNNTVAMSAVDAAIQTLGGHLNGPGRIAELSALESDATQSISSFFSGLGAVIEIPPPSIEEILKTASVKISDGNNLPRSFSDHGHGTQRTVQMALIQLLAKYSGTVNPAGSKTAILIDEPELYLHPQAIGLVRSALKQLSSSDFQVFFTTHSPMMVDAEDSINTSVFWKCPTDGTKVRARASSGLVNITTAQHQVDVLFSLKHSSQWLFSETPIIVEGKTERVLLPEIFAILKGSSLSAGRFALIEASGSGSSVPIAELLKNLGYAPKTILDLDFAFKSSAAMGILGEGDQDIAACKNWFLNNATANNFALDHSGLPTKSQGGLKPEAAYALLGQSMTVNCANLHAKLLPHNLWLWQGGAIEAHLGIPKNNDSAKANFLATARANSNVNHAANGASIHDLVNWL